MKRDDYYEKMHQKNIKTFVELAKLIVKGFLKITSIQIDSPEFGHRRIIILLHDEQP